MERIVTPIFKKGCKLDPSNYRPVSLTSVVCKVMERIISGSILEHVKSNSLQCSQQHGFTTGRSTTTNLIEAINIWSEALSHNVPVDVIFLDYAKAFDTVSSVSSSGCLTGSWSVWSHAVTPHSTIYHLVFVI